MPVLSEPGTPEHLRGLRLALVLNDSRMGGSERQALLLAGELKRRGAHSMILGLAGDGAVLDKARAMGVEADAVQLLYPLSPWYFPFNLARAWRIFRRHRADVIVGYTSVPNLYAGWLRRGAGARAFVWSERNAGLDRPRAWMERRAMKGAGAFIANSRSGMDFLQRAFPEGRDRMVVIPNAVEIPARASDAAGRQVVCVAHGRGTKKDHETLLKAWRIVGRSGGSEARLVLAGYFEQGDAYADRIRALAAEPDLAESVRFAGASEAIPDLLARSAIGVLSSRNEGMPNAVLEYMAAGLPVVATDLPGIRLALGEESDHWLAPEGDAEALAERMLELMRDPALRGECGRRNRARAEAEFSVAALGERTLAVLRGALR
jgi:glycosyltransferase involved in cell wall biosynthesis